MNAHIIEVLSSFFSSGTNSLQVHIWNTLFNEKELSFDYVFQTELQIKNALEELPKGLSAKEAVEKLIEFFSSN